VVIEVEEHPFFKRQENDIYCDVPITFTQAALGEDISVPTLQGKEKLRIPEGTQTGAVFRLRGRGAVSLNGRGQGDQVITVTVVTPTHLNREQRQLLQRLAEVAGEKGEQDEGTLFEKVKEIFG
jgi:molecular chaperone DnaJ